MNKWTHEQYQHSYINTGNCSANMHLIMRRFWNERMRATRTHANTYVLNDLSESTRLCSEAKLMNAILNSNYIKFNVCNRWKVHKMFKIIEPKNSRLTFYLSLSRSRFNLTLIHLICVSLVSQHRSLPNRVYHFILIFVHCIVSCAHVLIYIYRFQRYYLKSISVHDLVHLWRH